MQKSGRLSVEKRPVRRGVEAGATNSYRTIGEFVPHGSRYIVVVAAICNAQCAV